MKRALGSFCLVLSLGLAGLASAAEFDRSAFDRALQALPAYHYGDPQPDLNELERLVSAAATDAALRGEVEQELLRAFAAASANDARQFICRQLRTIGTARSVAVLESFLGDPELSHMARYALGRIEGPESEQALLRALGRTTGNLRAGIINTLAQRQDPEAVPALVPLLEADDPVVRTAAVRALGRLGDETVTEVLQQQRVAAEPGSRGELDDALLASAERFLAEGEARAAARIYRRYYPGGESEELRVAGLTGLARARPRRAVQLLVEAVESGDPRLSGQAFSLLAHSEAADATGALVALYSGDGAERQEGAVRALAERGNPIAQATLIEATTHTDERVRLAAYEGLGRIGGPQALLPLARGAAQARGQEKQLARATLVSLRGPEVEASLIQNLNQADPAVRAELVWAIGQREDRAAFPDLFRIARNEPEAAVRREAILALGLLAQPADLSDLLRLVTAPREADDRATIERSVLMVFGKTDDREAQAGPVLEALPNVPDAAQVVLLGLLCHPATPAALAAVREAVRSAKPEVSDAAIRALGDWPNAEPAEDLYRIAAETANSTRRALALRSYVRMAALSDQPMPLLVQALAISKDDADLKLVLAGLAQTDSLEALELAEKYAAVETLKAEARQAVIQVASQYGWQDSARARRSLEALLGSDADEALRGQAREALHRLEQYGDTLNAWKGCGPFKLAEVNDGNTVFNTPFAPEENPDAPGLRWVTVQAAFEGDQRLNLEATFGPLDYCCAYVRTMVMAPQEQDARVEWAADDNIKGWMNGRPIEGGRVKLRQGANALMLKVADHAGGWNFNCRLLRPDGRAVEGLRCDLGLQH